VNLNARSISLALKPFSLRISLAFLLLFSLLLLFIGKSQAGIWASGRNLIAENVAGLIEIAASPINFSRQVSAYISDIAKVYDQNKLLKSENAQMRSQLSEAASVQEENIKLRRLLKFSPAEHLSHISARVVGESSANYRNSAIISLAQNQKVKTDSAVVNESGLVGRIIEAGKKSARVLLLTDINSRIPIISQNSHEHAIAAGSGGDSLNLIYLPELSKIKVGEQIITAGDGGMLPQGLPVGVVTSIEKNSIKIKPFVDFYRLEYVSVIDF